MYFMLYNSKRFHQALRYKAPNEVYQTGIGGGVTIVDHFSDKRVSLKEEVGQRQSAVTKSILS
jgi:putative transposase